jgi:hypothetical protein
MRSLRRLRGTLSKRDARDMQRVIQEGRRVAVIADTGVRPRGGSSRGAGAGAAAAGSRRRDQRSHGTIGK